MNSEFAGKSNITSVEAAPSAGRLPKRAWVTPSISKLDSDETESGAAATKESNNVNGCMANNSAAAVTTCPS
ncbi:MAG: hypothetical protein RLZZ15_544 [Verrucomicrobiota bacterium]